jgi:membrane protein implicated in regulation of membrane protease activity
VDLQTRWLTALGIVVALVVGAIAATFATCPWLGSMATLAAVAIALIWGRWPEIRARRPAVQRGILWERKPRYDGMQITLRSSLAGQQGYRLTYIGGPAKIEEARVEEPVSGGTLVLKLEEPMVRATASEIVVLVDTAPSTTVRLTLTAPKEVRVTGVRHLRNGDLRRMNWTPQSEDPRASQAASESGPPP